MIVAIAVTLAACGASSPVASGAEGAASPPPATAGAPLSPGGAGSQATPATAPAGAGATGSQEASPSAAGGAATLAGGSASPAGGAATPGSGSGASAPTVPLAVVTGFGNYLVDTLGVKDLGTRLRAGSLIVPCGSEAAVAAVLHVTGAPPANPCVAADAIPSRLRTATRALALLPPGLVTPGVRVVPIGDADLFGDRVARALPYPLVIPTPPGWPADWTAYDQGNVRVVVTTGVNCPDRGVSHETNVLGKGWDWLLQGGTARYSGRHWDPSFGWWVVDPVRTGHAGALAALIRNADVATSDFECSMTRTFVQHDHGTVFTIDPRVAPLMAKAGFDVATIAADHNTNAGLEPVVETVNLFKANGIEPVGGGRNLAQALRPAVIDVNGLKFGFVGFDAIGGSVSATAAHAGVAPLTAANARIAISAARAAGAQVVFAMPQWSSVEYRASFTSFQRQLITLLQTAGADHIIGADFHWAGGVSITRAPAASGSASGRSAYRFVGSSEGNFWFGQNWSRQTQEGIITSLAFVGTRLAQVRFTPTVVVDNAQVNLTDPATDGQFVLKQVLGASTLPNP